MKNTICRFSFILCLPGFILSGYSQDKKPNQFILMGDIVYTINDTLKADFYLPLNYKQQKNPVLIFFAGGDFRKSEHYIMWASFCAAEGFVGICYDANREDAAGAFDALLDFIFRKSSNYFIDDQQVSMYAGSGPVTLALPIANENRKIKAAIFFYGTGEIKNFRLNLPVFLLRSGLDNAGLNRKLDTLAFRALQANAPYTIFNFNSAIHGFEDVSDPVIKTAMKSAIDFLKINMSKNMQERFAQKENEITAMRELYVSNWSAALAAFKLALKANPGNDETERQMGNVYIELKEYENAINAFDSSLAHGNWRRGEIAVKKCVAYAALNNAEGAVAEMKILKKIGWFDETSYTNNSLFKNVISSEIYRQFVNGK